MFYLVHVHGRRDPMAFDRFSAADSYRRVMLAAGKFARITGADGATGVEGAAALVARKGAPVAS